MSSKTTPARGRLFVISAPSGAGKTSLTHAVIERMAQHGCSLRFSVSCTTRAPRSGEADGVDYHFVDMDTFKAMVAGGKFLEYASVFGRGYGTARDRTQALLDAGHNVILDIDWQGARQVRVAAADAVSVFIKPPSYAELERRLRSRGLDDEQTIQQRLANAREEVSHAGEFDHVVVNDDFDAALDALEAVICAAGVR